MQDDGFAIMESMNAAIYSNVMKNVCYGLRISLGGAGNKIYDNTFDSCSGCECQEISHTTDVRFYFNVNVSGTIP